MDLNDGLQRRPYRARRGICARHPRCRRARAGRDHDGRRQGIHGDRRRPGSTGSACSTRWSARSSRGPTCGRTSGPRSAIPAPQAPLVLPEAPPPPPPARLSPNQLTRQLRRPAERRQFERHPAVGAGCGAGAMSRPLTTRDRRRAGRDARGAGLSAGSVARRASPEAAHPDGRGEDAGAAGAAVGAICRACCSRTAARRPSS